MINEQDARRAKENMSFSSYKEGSATDEFNTHIANITAEVNQAKAKVSEEGKQRLDALLQRYTSQYAQWINRYNANGAKHVSVMIAGPSNYDLKAHNRFMDRESKLWKEYDEFKDISYKISAIVDGDKIIKSNDPSAIEKLQEKLTKAQEEHARYKDHNAKARKEGTEALPAYVLANSNGRMKAIKERITHLERLAKLETTVQEVESEIVEIKGIQIVDNVQLNRLQIIFNGKPSADIRNDLKKNGFKWSPTNTAWQRFRSATSTAIAKQLIEKWSA